MTIGDRIKSRRIQLGMTQEELALKLGYKSKSSINKIEIGVQDLPQKKIEAFAKALETTPAELMGWTDSENLEGVQINEHHTEYYIDAETRKLAQELHDNPELSVMLDAIKTLSPQDARLVMDMVRRMQNEGTD